MKIILLGYMGSGKTGVGKLLSSKLNIPFSDLDNLISEAENRSIPEIFHTSGEIYFRKKETQVLQQFLDTKKEFVLSLGGGTPCYGNNMELLKQSKANTVYLKTSLEELKKRLFEEKESRPLIAHLNTAELLEDFIRKHLFERSYYYNQSDLIVQTDSKKMPEIAEEIIQKGSSLE